MNDVIKLHRDEEEDLYFVGSCNIYKANKSILRNDGIVAIYEEVFMNRELCLTSEHTIKICKIEPLPEHMNLHFGLPKGILPPQFSHLFTMDLEDGKYLIHEVEIFRIYCPDVDFIIDDLQALESILKKKDENEKVIWKFYYNGLNLEKIQKEEHGKVETICYFKYYFNTGIPIIQRVYRKDTETKELKIILEYNTKTRILSIHEEQEVKRVKAIHGGRVVMSKHHHTVEKAFNSAKDDVEAVKYSVKEEEGMKHTGYVKFSANSSTEDIRIAFDILYGKLDECRYLAPKDAKKTVNKFLMNNACYQRFYLQEIGNFFDMMYMSRYDDRDYPVAHGILLPITEKYISCYTPVLINTMSPCKKVIRFIPTGITEITVQISYVDHTIPDVEKHGKTLTLIDTISMKFINDSFGSYEDLINNPNWKASTIVREISLEDVLEVRAEYLVTSEKETLPLSRITYEIKEENMPKQTFDLIAGEELKYRYQTKTTNYNIESSYCSDAHRDIDEKANDLYKKYLTSELNYSTERSSYEASIHGRYTYEKYYDLLKDWLRDTNYMEAIEKEITLQMRRLNREKNL